MEIATEKLILKYLTSQADLSERNQLIKWISLNGKHDVILDKRKALWDLLYHSQNALDFPKSILFDRIQSKIKA